MNDPNNSLEIYRERITRVETRVDYVVVEQSRQAALLETMARQIASNELVSAALRDRTEQHTKTIEHLQESEVDVGKILESMKTQLNIIKYVGSGLATLLLGYLFSHFIK